MFSVYLPCRSVCTDVFRESLEQLDAVLGSLAVSSDIIILGDFADPGSQRGPLSTTKLNEQGRILVRFLVNWNLVFTHLHKSYLFSSAYYESEAHATPSTIDHIMCQERLLPPVNSSHPLPDHHLNLSDCLPVITSFRIHHNLPQVPSSVSKSTPSFTPRDWNSVSEETICSLYSTPLQQRLEDMLSNLQPTKIQSSQTLVSLITI